MDVLLPRRLNSQGMYYLIQQTIDEDLRPKSNKVCFIFSDMEFIEPVGVTVLSNLTEWLMKKGIEVTYRCPKQRYLGSAHRFLDDSQFFHRYIKTTLVPNARPRVTTIPLELVAYHESHQWLDRATVWLSQKLQVSRQSLGTIKSCFQEIFNNINDHSQESTGCVFVQQFPKKNEIQVAISDFGVGIPYNVQKQYPSLNDGQAIKKATEQGYSTKSSPRNRGAGLDMLIKNVVNNNGGRVYIYSNHGILNCVDGKTEISPNFYPGTLLEIVFRTDTIGSILDSEEEFEWDM